MPKSAKACFSRHYTPIRCVLRLGGDDTHREWPGWVAVPTRWLGSEGRVRLSGHEPRVPSARFWHFGTREASGTWHFGTRPCLAPGTLALDPAPDLAPGTETCLFLWLRCAKMDCPESRLF